MKYFIIIGIIMISLVKVSTGLMSASSEVSSDRTSQLSQVMQQLD